jgi:RNA polymerase sigma-70 factor (ECF subfamily)
MVAAGDSLVARAGRGQHEAFAEIVEARLDRVYRTANAILNNEADARDVTQDVFTKAWTHLPGLRDADRFDAWLMRMTVNRCRDLLRRRHRSREIVLEELPPTAQPSARGIEISEVSAALERLSTEDRAILVLHHLHGQPVKEIAQTQGMPAGTVKWRLHQARQRLAQFLEADA